MVMGTRSYNLREQDFAAALGPKPLKPRNKPHQGHFDPDELRRRLYLVLADRKAHDERRRIKAEEAKHREAKSRTAREQSIKDNSKDGKKSSKDAVPERKSSSNSKTQISEKQPSQPSSTKSRQKEYSEKSSSTEHQLRKEKSVKPTSNKSSPPKEEETFNEKSSAYVPQEAAKQFTRTTTVNGMRDRHHRQSNNNPVGTNLMIKISKQALKYHLTGGARSKPIPENSSSPSHDQENQRPTYLSPSQLDNRRNSTSDNLARATASSETRRSMVIVDSLAQALEEDVDHREPLSPREVNEHRVDWTQSDETFRPAAGNYTTTQPQPQPQSVRQQTQKKTTVLNAVVRKADSFWMLRGRLGSGSKAMEGGMSEADGGFERVLSGESVVPFAPKGAGGEREGGGAAGFFAKFKR